ncbi:unnamed protein product, partial [Iphiclides podalirius]
MPWSRPSNLPVGQVWSRFRGRERNGVPGTMYQIRDMELSDRKRCLDMMEGTFLRDEPLSQILDIQSDLVSVSTIRSNWERYAEQGICLACYTEEDGVPRELVGCNILVVKSADDEEGDIDNVSGETWRKLLRTLVTAEGFVDVFEHYGVDRYLTSSGLAVVPPHRGQNIGAQIINARRYPKGGTMIRKPGSDDGIPEKTRAIIECIREAICKAFGFDATATVFTARSSQVLAAKCGYQQLAVLPYEDMLQHGIDLTGCATPSAVLMGRQYNVHPAPDAQ